MKEKAGLSEALRAHYEDYYSSDTEWRDLSAQGKARNITALAARLSPRRVVDIGTGDGAVAAVLLRNGFCEHITGYDISTSGIEVAQKRKLIGADFRVFDGDSIPDGHGTYDLALLSHVLEHVEFPRRLIYEASRVARFVFVEVPLELNARAPKHFRWTPTGHINLYSPTVIRHLVESCGCEVLSEEVVCPHLEVFRYSSSRVGGLVKWMVKRGLLLIPPLATGLLTYHGCLLAQREEISIAGLGSG